MYVRVWFAVYAFTMGHFALVGVTLAVEQEQNQLLNKPIEDGEFIFAANILSEPGSTTLNKGHKCIAQHVVV